MIRIQAVHLAVREMDEHAALLKKAAAALHVAPGKIKKLQILKKAIDARDKHHLLFTYTLAVEVAGEAKLLAKNKNKNLSAYHPADYSVSLGVKGQPGQPPVIVGAGPAGLFCALVLTSLGIRPILLERGKPVEERITDVTRFFHSGALCENSNIQFGEGGAGTFSDGKLHTGTRDLRQHFVLETLVAHGAPKEILYEANAHIGTDRLREVIVSMRNELLRRGCEIRFSHRLSGLELAGTQVRALRVSAPQGEYRLPCEKAVLAIGHSARDTFTMLYESGLAMRAKRFAVGVRLEQKQAHINALFYGGEAAARLAGPASYKLSYHTQAKRRGVFSFCVCPGGTVVAAASEKGRVATNGMSVYRRDGENCNGAILAEVSPAQFGGSHPLAGMYYQRQLEQAAYLAGGGGYLAPAQLAGDFLRGVPSSTLGTVQPTYLPGVKLGNLADCLPADLIAALREGLAAFNRRMPGFLCEDALLTAVESRSSSPVRIERNETMLANIGGIYPCAEGAGYAGGIMSAAVDGMRCAEALYQAL